jgi:hypothetical protein
VGQIFKPAANTVALISLFLGAGAPVIIFLTGSQITRAPYGTKVGIPIDQPVPFSHKHHAKELGIDCRFCHHTVEVSASASVPATEVCMTCHSQVWPNSPNLEPVRKSWETGTSLEWVKVNAVPDFVYFNHSIHIARGISCNNCHGEVQEMVIMEKGNAFRMSWCLECHRNPAAFMYSTTPGTDPEKEHAEHGAEGAEHEATEAKKLSPREQVFELYRKIAAGERLNEVEEKLAEGLPQRAPNDKVHEGLILMKDRKINVSQLDDCYVCHH